MVLMHRYWGFVDFNFAPAVVVHGDVVLYVWGRRAGGVAEPVSMPYMSALYVCLMCSMCGGEGQAASPSR